MARTCTRHGLHITNEPHNDCPVCLAEYEQQGEPDGFFFCGGPHPSTACPEVD
jgi:hypothetical protein